MSTVILGTLQSNSSSPPTFNDNTSTEIGRLCRAFVNFNGTGVIAIRASFNVTSITDNGTGDYRVNFTNAFSDANYSAVCTGNIQSSQCLVSQWDQATGNLVGSFRLITATVGGALNDAVGVNAAFFR